MSEGSQARGASLGFGALPPLVSVVVPTYNQAEYLGACLDSIYFQDHPNLEIIVVDDCSTDGTRDILAEFERSIRNEMVSYAAYYDEAEDVIERVEHSRYPQAGRRFIALRNETNLGSTPTYNRAFQTATGEFCTYIASDDLCHPQMISTLARPLEAGVADFVYSDMIIVDDEGRILRAFELPDYDFEACFQDWYLCGVSKLYRRALHDQLGFYDESTIANDHDLYLRFALAATRFLHVPKVLYSVRSHNGRATDIHSESNWSRLLGESKRLVRRARATGSGSQRAGGRR